VAIEEIASDALGDDGFIGLESVEVAVTHLCCDFEAHVQELTHVGIVAGVALVVSESTDVLFTGPAVDFLGAWELGVINVDDGGVGLAKGFLFLEGLGVDFLREGEPVSTCSG